MLYHHSLINQNHPNLLRSSSLPLHLSAALLLTLIILSIALPARIYLRYHNKLKKISHYSQREQLDHDLILAWNQLNELSPKSLTSRQRKKYEKYRIYLRILMGNLSGAEREIEKIKDIDPAYYHFLRYINCNAVGHIKEAAEQIKRADEACDADTDKQIRIQILANRGVSYVILGQFKDADDCFYAAIQYGQKYRIQQKSIWEVLYYNFIFNKTRLKPDITMDELQPFFDEMKIHFDMELPVDYLMIQNIQMELLRQTNAGKKAIDENIYYSFDYLMHSSIPEVNRCVLEASIARMIWSARLDPSGILEAMNGDLEAFRSLPMPAKYKCFKELDLLFQDLHGDIVTRYDRLKQNAIWYMTNQAEADLEQFRQTLPQEAIYERCFCFREIAGLQKRRADAYSWEKMSEQFSNALILYEENGLELDIQMCRLAMIDEGCAPANLDQRFNLRHLAEMHRQLQEIESFLPSIEKHPVLTELYLRLSFYCLRMDEYEKCKQYYERFAQQSRTFSNNHFAPWMHAYHMVVSFAVRVLYFIEAADLISRSPELLNEDRLVRDWFQYFYQGDGLIQSIVLGGFMGYKEIPVKSRIWIRDENKDEEDKELSANNCRL